jgi:hypothetical protein
MANELINTPPGEEGQHPAWIVRSQRRETWYRPTRLQATRRLKARLSRVRWGRHSRRSLNTGRRLAGRAAASTKSVAPLLTSLAQWYRSPTWQSRAIPAALKATH